MRTLTLQRRNLLHHWRAHLAVLLGVVAGTAALTGALLVGDSVRGSLRNAALERLGRVDYVVEAPQFFRAELADDIAASGEFKQHLSQVVALIRAHGSVSQADTHATVHAVQVLGVTERFWQFGTIVHAPASGESERGIVLNQALADDLGARREDDVLVRVPKPTTISPETLLGRRDDALVALRLTVRDIVPSADLGALALSPQQTVPRNAYIPLTVLQRALGQRERANVLLCADRPGATAADLSALVQRHVLPTDLGLRLRESPKHGYVAIESESFLLAPSVEAAARAATESIGAQAAGVLAYLANKIQVESRPGAVIPYSTVAAVEPAVLSTMKLVGDAGAATLAPGEILLNSWAADELHAVLGDTLRLWYYGTGPFGQLETRSADFHLHGVVPLEGAAADPGFTPAYPGVSDARSLAEWNPPFPIDLGLVHSQDEEYWRKYTTTPKAFISLADGQRQWAVDRQRFGALTALRAYVPAGSSLTEASAALQRELLRRLDVSQVGWRIVDVRAQALAASTGSTDFAGLFIGFSFFLIVAAALLVALLFRLGVERRGREIGLLLALGFRRRQVTALLLTEGLIVALVGAADGLLLADGYAWLMLAGLRSWWAAAVHAPFLQLHGTLQSYAIGFVLSVAIAGLSIAWALRGLAGLSPRRLLGGAGEASYSAPHRRTRPTHSGRDDQGRLRRSRGAGLLAGVATIAAAVLLILPFATKSVPQTAGFFGGGTALLIALLAGLAQWLGAVPHAAPHFTGRWAVVRLGLRNARRHPVRSLLMAGLIATATFVITALQAFRADATAAAARDSGTGGYALVAEADVPVYYDLNTPTGRRALNMSADVDAAFAGVQCVPLRRHAGDEASCLNLYRPGEPTILGASDDFIAHGGFSFAAVQAPTSAPRDCWPLLRESLPDGAVPAIADEASARWQMHLDLGDELHILDERGRDVRLRLVALLRGSVLQGEVIIAEAQFTRLFPSIAGYAFYLIDAPADRAAQVRQVLQGELSDFGLAVTPTPQRLNELLAVQNTYLATFQALGGLGLLLGTLGLGAVLLRNVWERRGELALLRTLGFSRGALGVIVIVENVFLVLAGLLAGLFSAAVVTTPQIVTHALALPWTSLLLMFTGIFAAGLLAGLVALLPALRTPLLPALRSE